MGTIAQLLPQMDVSALMIATFGALFSIASALYLTSRKISSEFKMSRYMLTHTYAQNVLSRRLDAYPEIWGYVCEYEKVVLGFPGALGEKRRCDINYLLSFNESVSQWDNRHGLLLSPNAGLACWKMRMVICEALENASLSSKDSSLPAIEIEKILKYSSRLEVALRTDIGVYEVDKLEERKKFKNYDEANRDIFGVDVKSLD